MNKFKTQPLISIWLMPAKQDKLLLRKTMNDLNIQYNAPKFKPHITMYSTHVPANKVNQTKKIISNLVKIQRPIILSVSDIKHSDFLFKSLYTEFKKNPALDKLHKLLRKELEQYGDYPFNPHLSLLYKTLDPKENERVIKRIQIPRVITFDTLGITVHMNKQELMNIPEWKVTIL